MTPEQERSFNLAIESMATINNSINLMFGEIYRLGERLTSIEWRQEWQLGRWQRFWETYRFSADWEPPEPGAQMPTRGAETTVTWRET